MPRTVLLTLTAWLAVVPAQGRIINHFDVDGVPKLPQVTTEAIGQQKWFFTHASLGMNCVLHRGMDGLHKTNPSRYQLTRTQVEPAFGSSPDPPPNPTVPGTIYHWPRGGGWSEKLQRLDNAVRNVGWRDAAVDMVMDKLCFIDYAAKADVYLTTMAGLERDYPDTVFVYVTLPLLRADVPEHPEWRVFCVSTNEYNDAVRAHCAAHGNLLFDLADIQAHDPGGNPYTYTVEGREYKALYPGYAAGSSNYLNELGSQRVALGWYATAAVIANDPRGDLDCDGEVDFDDIEPFVLALSGQQAYAARYPNCYWYHADCNGDRKVDFDDIDPFVALLGGS